MQISKQIQGPVTVLSIRDAIVEEELGVLDDEIQECFEVGCARIVLDIRGVPFIDSAGLERIQKLMTELGRRRGDLRIAAANDVCKDIFLSTRMDSFVQVAEDTDSAVRSLTG